MKSGTTETIDADEPADGANLSSSSLSTITIRFVTLLSAIVVFLTWAWSR